MSPTSREKAYARRRYEDWQRRQAQKLATRRRRRRNAFAAVGSIVGVGLVVGGVMYFTGESDSDRDPAAASPAASASASKPADPNNPCAAPAAATGNPKSFSKVPSASDAKGKKFTVTVETSCGPLLLALDGTKAPQAVASFVYLAKQGFFDKTPCHRLTTTGIYVLQCGDPTGTGTGGPGYQFGPIENAPADGRYPAGTVAMARANAPDSMGSQFFLVYKDSTLPTDGGGYTIMGTITGGKDVVEKVAAGGVEGGSGDGKPVRAISLTKLSVAQG